MPLESSCGRIFWAIAQLGPQALVSEELTQPEEAKPGQPSYTPAGPSSFQSHTKPKDRGSQFLVVFRGIGLQFFSRNPCCWQSVPGTDVHITVSPKVQQSGTRAALQVGAEPGSLQQLLE